jgi:hypothetical protein
VRFGVIVIVVGLALARLAVHLRFFLRAFEAGAGKQLPAARGTIDDRGDDDPTLHVEYLPVRISLPSRSLT